MNPNRKAWNERHQQLKAALADPAEHVTALRLFFEQHGAVHTAGISGAPWSFQDEVCGGLTADDAHAQPPGVEHPIAWLVWHMTRIEDFTLNILAAGGEQVYISGGWQAKLGAPSGLSGNNSDPAAVVALSDALDWLALLDYRRAVGERTRVVVAGLSAADLRAKVDAGRLARLTAEGCVPGEATEVLAYWGGLRIAGLLTMPATRHPFVHWNEALEAKEKISRNPLRFAPGTRGAKPQRNTI
jgi:hypothetical protein